MDNLKTDPSEPQRLHNLFGDATSLGVGNLFRLLHPLPQGNARDQFHGDEGGLLGQYSFVDLNDVWVRDLSHEPSFADKAFFDDLHFLSWGRQVAKIEKLESHFSAQTQVSGPVYSAHATFTDQFGELEVLYRFPNLWKLSSRHGVVFAHWLPHSIN